MRGTKAKRLRKLGLKSGPQPREERFGKHVPRPKVGWERTTKLKPNAEAEARAEAKRERRRQRNLRNARS